MPKLTEKQYEDAAKFLNTFVNTMQFVAKSLINTAESFQQKKINKKFMTSFNNVLYCVAKLQLLQKHNDENLKYIYKQFEDDFSQWREIHSDVVPESYIFKSFHEVEFDSQLSYASQIIAAHNLLDSENAKGHSQTVENQIISDNNTISPTLIKESTSKERTNQNDIDPKNEENSENLSFNQTLNSNELVEFISLMDSEDNEILNRSFDQYERTLILKEDNYVTSTPEESKPGPDRLLNDPQNDANSSDDILLSQLKPEILSLNSEGIATLNGSHTTENNVQKGDRELPKILNDTLSKNEPTNCMQNSSDDINLSQMKFEIMSQDEVSLQAGRECDNDDATSKDVQALNLHVESDQNLKDNKNVADSNGSFEVNSRKADENNINTNKEKDDVSLNNTHELEPDFLQKDSTFLRNKTSDSILNLNENSSSMDEEKMAKIEAKLLSDSDPTYLHTEPTSDHNSGSSVKDIEDIDELLSEIDISDDDFRAKYREAIRNIYNDSASCDSSSTSELSSDSELEYENQVVLKNQKSGKIVQVKIYNEDPNPNSDLSDDKCENINDTNISKPDNCDKNLFKKCVVAVERMDLSSLQKSKCASNSDSDNFDKLLNISDLNRKRRRVSSASSTSLNKSKTKRNSTKKQRRMSNSSSTTISSSSESSSTLDNDLSDDEVFRVSEDNISDWIPEISDISSNAPTDDDKSNTESDSVEDEADKKKRKKPKTKNTKGSKQIENGASEGDEKTDKSDDDWRNDPLLRFSLNDSKRKKKKESESENSDVEAIDSSSDDVIICEETTNTEKNLRKPKNLLRSVKRKKQRLPSISSDADSSDESVVFQGETKPRRRYRKVMSYQELAEATKKANEDEKARMQRLTQRLSAHSTFNEEQEPDPNTLILDYDMETKKPRVQVHPELCRVLKDHQKEGVKFMWDSCYESIDCISTNPGSGCVLAHCMGLGKTLQVVTLIHTLFSHEETQVRKVLILAPVTTIKNWEREFYTWLSKLETKFTVDSVIGKISPAVRGAKIKAWFNTGGVFIMSYNLFRLLAYNPTTVNNATSADKRLAFCRKALINPGPDLIVCDEGHTLKNHKSEISKCISGIKTGRRIMLTGTPMQNNLKEYYCMINLVKPNLLGSAIEFANQFGNPITKGQAKDSSASAIRMMKRRAHVLHKKLTGVVQRMEGSILKPYLPSLKHYVIFVKMSKEQVTIYKKFIEMVKSDPKPLLLLTTYQRAKKIYMHPICLYYRQPQAVDSIATPPETEIVGNDEANIFKDQTWHTSLYSKAELERVECSTKLLIFFHILNQCEMLGDKVVAFSTSLNILNSVEYFLKRTPITDIVKRKWEYGLDYVRVDGSTSSELRDQIYESFNSKENSRLRLLIATTKVTGLGLNLLGANRIVIFDTSWNPSDDMQSVYRIYRLGQTKDCFIYSLVSLGSMEEKIYERCVTKQAISCRVIDEQQVDRHYLQKGNIIKEFFTFIDYEEMERPAPNVPSDRILATALQKYPEYIFKYHEHDKLLQNQEDEELDEAEREAAWQEFQMEEERLKRAAFILPKNSFDEVNIPHQPVVRQQNPLLISPEVQFTGSYFFKNADPKQNSKRYFHKPDLPPKNDIGKASKFFDKLQQFANIPNKNVRNNQDNHLNIPSTSRAHNSEGELIISDILPHNANGKNPYINESRLTDIIAGANKFRSSEPLTDQAEIELDGVVIIED